jgi:ferredoxin-NADP reductase
VLRKVCEGDDICSIYLAPHDRKRLPAFRPGAVPIPVAGAGLPKPIVRCYSLSDILRDNYIASRSSECHRRRIVPMQPPGGSSYFHDRVKEGDILDVRAAAESSTSIRRRAAPSCLWLAASASRRCSPCCTDAAE